MTHCPFQPLLSPYQDDELALTDRHRIERHLLACPTCAADLADLRDLATRITTSAEAYDLTQALAGMHRAIDRASAETIPACRLPSPSLPLSRFVAPLGALAASVLIIAGVWRLDAQPVAAPASPDPAPVAVAPDWERVAVTLRAEPRAGVIADSPFAPRYADAIHWMLDSLASAPTEEKSWPLSKSF